MALGQSTVIIFKCTSFLFVIYYNLYSQALDNKQNTTKSILPFHPKIPRLCNNGQGRLPKRAQFPDLPYRISPSQMCFPWCYPHYPSFIGFLPASWQSQYFFNGFRLTLFFVMPVSELNHILVMTSFWTACVLRSIALWSAEVAWDACLGDECWPWYFY